MDKTVRRILPDRLRFFSQITDKHSRLHDIPFSGNVLAFQNINNFGGNLLRSSAQTRSLSTDSRSKNATSGMHDMYPEKGRYAKAGSLYDVFPSESASPIVEQVGVVPKKTAKGNNYILVILGVGICGVTTYTFMDKRMNEYPPIKRGECEMFYRLGRTLGQGSFAIVKRAFNRETGQDVAVKIMKKSSMTQTAQASLLSELKLVKHLNHPHIVGLYEVIDGSDNLCFVMELMTGGELFDRILMKERYSEAEAKDVVRQILQAVEHCHHHEIVHRDIKPENLLFLSSADDSPLKLADFGLATILKPNEMLHLMCGTPTYVAPEVIDSSSGRGYGKSVDIWAVGVITYILLSGSTPFHDESMPKLFAQIVTAKYTFPDQPFNQISNEAKDFVTRLLESDPSKRLTASASLEHPWIINKKLSDTVPLEGTRENLREFNARRRLKGAIHVIQAALYLRKDSPSRRSIPANSTAGQIIPATGRVNRLSVRTGIITVNRDEISPISQGATTTSSKTSGSSMRSFPSSPDTPDPQYLNETGSRPRHRITHKISRDIQADQAIKAMMREERPIASSSISDQTVNEEGSKLDRIVPLGDDLRLESVKSSNLLPQPSKRSPLSLEHPSNEYDPKAMPSPRSILSELSPRTGQSIDSMKTRPIPSESPEKMASLDPNARKSKFFTEDVDLRASAGRRLSSSIIPTALPDMGTTIAKSPSSSNMIASPIGPSPAASGDMTASMKRSISGVMRPQSAKMNIPAMASTSPTSMLPRNSIIATALSSPSNELGEPNASALSTDEGLSNTIIPRRKSSFSKQMLDSVAASRRQGLASDDESWGEYLSISRTASEDQGLYDGKPKEVVYRQYSEPDPRLSSTNEVPLPRSRAASIVGSSSSLQSMEGGHIQLVRRLSEKSSSDGTPRSLRNSLTEY